MTPDSSERSTIFVMTGCSSSREMVGTDDGRGSSARVFVLSAAILPRLPSDGGVNSENSMLQRERLFGKGERASLILERPSASSSDLIAVI